LEKLDQSSMFSQLIAYTLTALSVLGIGKKYTQKLVDALLRRQASKKNKSPPEDVLRRETVLDEHAITRRSGRRLSTVFKNVGGSNIELTVIDDQEKANAAVSHFSNPMKQNDSNLVGRLQTNFQAPSPSPRRGGASSSMEEKMEQLIRDNIEMKKQLKENKKQLQKLTQKVVGSKPGKTTPGSQAGAAETKTTTKQRTKRLSKVMKARRNSQSTSVQVHVDKATGRRYSVNTATGKSTWLDEEGEGASSPNKPEKRAVTKRQSFKTIKGENGTYYQNVDTGDTVWKVPKGGEIIEM
jgi:hypothetical protein